MSSQITIQLDDNAEEAVEELKAFFGTKSSAAAIRTALALARTLYPTTKNGMLIVRDQQKNDQELRIVLAR